MIQIFFTIIFIAELIIVLKIISIIKKCNNRVIEINKDLKNATLELKQDLKEINEVSLKACQQTTGYAAAYKDKEFIRKIIVELIIGIAPLFFNAKWRSIILNTKTMLNFRNMSKIGIILGVLNLLKKHVKISKKRGVV